MDAVVPLIAISSRTRKVNIAARINTAAVEGDATFDGAISCASASEVTSTSINSCTSEVESAAINPIKVGVEEDVAIKGGDVGINVNIIVCLGG